MPYKNNKNVSIFSKLHQLDHNYFKRAKTSAMFGLDARIALAIFGALSVITGAALYSAINNAKQTSILTNLQEVEKAIEQYMLDTRKMLPFGTYATLSTYNLSIKALITKPSGVNNWKGPYLPHPGDSTEDKLLYPYYKVVITFRPEVWPYPADTRCLQSSARCFVFVGLEIDLEDAKAIENRIDRTNISSLGDVEHSGKIYYTKSADNKAWMLYKTSIPFSPENSPTP